MSKPPVNPEPDQANSPEPCGERPWMALLQLAKLKGGKLLSWTGEGTSPKDQTKGGADVAPAAALAPALKTFTASEKKLLLDLARATLQTAALYGREVLPEVCTKDYTPRLTENRACFVTLTKRGELRGCVGHVQAREPLCQAIAESARSAALSDPRFPAVTAGEVEDIKIEISVLSELQALSFASPEDLLRQLQPREHGVVLRLGSRTATFLPQVWDKLVDKAEFLNQLAEKAGCHPGAWRSKDASVSVYHVESFAEN